jgi:hypothetical protein
VAVLGLILLAAAGVLTAAVVTSNTDSLSVDLWGVSVTNVTLGVVFVAGMITTVLAVVGLGLLTGGLRRNRRLRQERRSLRRENEQLSQRVDAAPAADESALRADDRTRAVHDDRTQVLPDDTRTGVDEPRRTGEASVDGTPTTDGRQSFLPRRGARVPTDSGPGPHDS